MDMQDLFHSCKSGDMRKVQYLVEERQVDLNIKDIWNSTPLYYACLCGHNAIVEFLLEKGAKCKANTFEGQRCLYGALTDDIRNLLLNFDLISSQTTRRNPFEDFLKRLLETKLFTDVEFIIHGDKVEAHRGVLSARCDYLANLFNHKWQHRQVIRLNHPLVSKTAFECILHFIYTGQLDIPLDLIDDCVRLARYLGMVELEATVNKILKCTILGEDSNCRGKVTSLAIESTEMRNDLHIDLSRLAEKTFPFELALWVSGQLPFDSDFLSYSFSDVHFIVEGYTFSCHRAFFCGRSDYFKALLKDHFGENDTEDDIPVITLHNISCAAFIQVIYFLYSNTCCLSFDIVEEVLVSADIFLLPDLKTQCGSAMMMYVEASSVANYIRIARLFQLPRLEAFCNEFVAKNLSQVVALAEFQDLVLEDSETIRDREENDNSIDDSIDIIEKVRFHITNTTFGEMLEAQEKLQLIDTLLEDLGLEC